MFRTILVIFVAAIMVLTGCRGGNKGSSYAISKNDPNYEPTRDGDASQRMGGPAPGTVVPTTAVVPNNPGFITAKNIQLKSQNAKVLDGALRPVLKQLFKDVKIISEGEIPPNAEEVIDTFKYMTKARVTPDSFKELHRILTDQYNFGKSPRLGAKPTVTSSWGAMSLFKHTGGIQFSFAIYIDFKKQIMRVESYQLGSKYDRLM